MADFVKVGYCWWCHVKWLFYHHGLSYPQAADGADGLYVYKIVPANMYNGSEMTDKKWRLILGIKRCLIITHRRDLACCLISGRGKNQCEGSNERLGSGRRSGIACYQLNDFLLKQTVLEGVPLGDSVWWSTGVFSEWVTKRQLKTTSSMRSALFWDFSQRRIVIPYRRFGTICRCYLEGSGTPCRILLGLSDPENGINRLSRNIGTELKFCAA
jgi:hypothetical protein